MSETSNIIDIQPLLEKHKGEDKARRYQEFVQEALRLAAHLTSKPLDKPEGGC